jgi:hypothetical protein
MDPFGVKLVDYYDQPVVIDSVNSVTIYVHANVSVTGACYQGSYGYVTGATSETFSEGRAVFDTLQAFCMPGGLLEVEIRVDEGSLLTELQFAFRECEPGEILNQDVCQMCEYGTYSFDPTSGKCIECMENAECLGGDVISVDEGYWRQCHHCHDVLACRHLDYCLGGTDVGTQCREGHEGPLCNVCMEDYAFSADLTCAQCSSASTNATVIIPIVALCVVAVVAILLYMNRDFVQQKVEELQEFVHATIEKYEIQSASTKFKILIAFIQVSIVKFNILANKTIHIIILLY